MKSYALVFPLLLLAAAVEANRLLVVSYDGFRYDYLDKFADVTPVLNDLRSRSSFAKCLINVFPTQTFPNHFSIATGVYAGVHGVLGNKVFNKDTGKVFPYGYDLFHYNENVTPIWTLNELAGGKRHSGVVMWPGSDFLYRQTNATFNFKYNESSEFSERISTAVSWFMHPETPANFVMMYFEEPDAMTHAFGPDSPQCKEQIKRVDQATDYLMKSLDNNNLTDVNVIFLSDHGMEGVTVDRIIDLRPMVGDIADMYGTSPVLQIYPKQGVTVKEVYRKLKLAARKNMNFQVYLKDKIPKHFHIRDCRRTPPILAVANPPYAFQDLYDGIDWYAKYRSAPRNATYGVHGYDPRSVNMHPYFIAHGPLFKENYDAGELRTIDLYSLFARILRLKEPKNVKPNGSFSRISKLLKS